jgi:hypothetical protein
VLGEFGTGAELLLLGHTEEFWQLFPIVLLGLGVVSGVLVLVRSRRATLRVHQVLMTLFMIAGPVGLFQHYSANAEFELEMYPSMGGLELIWESLTGATPALAPGMMIYLGLLGLAYSYRHPVVKNTMERKPLGGEEVS